MGDLGLLDEEGQLWFCGRKQQRVITSKTTLFTVQCEGIFNQHPAVFRSALVGIGDKNNQTPVICIELEPEQVENIKIPKEKAALTQSILNIGKAHTLTQEISTLLFHPSFPVDIRHNAKIGREQLAIWAEQEKQ